MCIYILFFIFFFFSPFIKHAYLHDQSEGVSQVRGCLPSRRNPIGVAVVNELAGQCDLKQVESGWTILVKCTYPLHLILSWNCERDPHVEDSERRILHDSGIFDVCCPSS